MKLFPAHLSRFFRRWSTGGCFVVLVGYILVAFLAQIGLIASPWNETVGLTYLPPSLETPQLWLGTDIFGQSVLYKVIHGARISLSVGLLAAILSVVLGSVIGAVAGYFGGWVDDFIVAFYTTLASIPNVMLVLAMTYVLGRGMTAVYLALGLTSWVGLARIIRGEVLRHKSREYVLAAEGLGASSGRKIFRHILPNVSHFVIVEFSLQFVFAIKYEVVLSFLGLGVSGQPSWGVMIDDAKLELVRTPCVWWQLAGAAGAMFVVVLALNVLGDALRDAVDPKAKGW